MSNDIRLSKNIKILVDEKGNLAFFPKTENPAWRPEMRSPKWLSKPPELCEPRLVFSNTPVELPYPYTIEQIESSLQTTAALFCKCPPFSEKGIDMAQWYYKEKRFLKATKGKKMIDLGFSPLPFGSDISLMFPMKKRGARIYIGISTVDVSLDASFSECAKIVWDLLTTDYSSNELFLEHKSKLNL